MIVAVIFANILFFHLLFFISVRKKDFGIIDIGWGLSFVLIYFVARLNSAFNSNLRLDLIGLFVTLWGLRLSAYLFFRWLKKDHEDFRYANWRKEWESKANQTAYIRVFLLQAVLSLLIASPLILIFTRAAGTKDLIGSDILGALVWSIGFLWQSVADYQKNAFKSNPINAKKICQVGLWKYSRHPNYFGEALMWWGIFFLAIGIIPVYYAVWGPLLINFFLLNVSGVPLLEQAYQDRPEFSEYKRTTNKLIPWFPKKEKL